MGKGVLATAYALSMSGETVWEGISLCGRDGSRQNVGTVGGLMWTEELRIPLVRWLTLSSKVDARNKDDLVKWN